MLLKTDTVVLTHRQLLPPPQADKPTKKAGKGRSPRVSKVKGRGGKWSRGGRGSRGRGRGRPVKANARSPLGRSPT